MRKSRGYKVCLIIGLSVMSLLSCPAWAAPRAIEETQTVQSAQRQPKSMGRVFDLQQYYEMDDTRAAADALREHLRVNGLSLNTSEQNRLVRVLDSNAPAKVGRKTPNELIHVFNGSEFAPAPGLESSLASRVQQMVDEKTAEEKIVCILQIQEQMTLGDVINLLELGVKVYDPIGRRGAIVRLPASVIDELRTRPYIRWIGEYKPEYKYDPVPSTSRKPGALIYPLGGDRPEYRADLQQLGITIRGYDSIAGFYDVILDVSRFGEVASDLWWIKGIAKDPEEHLEEMTQVTVNYEPDDSRELIMAYNTSYTGSGVLVGVRDNAIYETHPQLSGIFHYDSELGGTYVHGTHVTGIIAGRAKTISGPWGNSVIKGVAPESLILFRQNAATFWDWVPWIESYTSDFDSFRNNGVQISNHSYHILDSSNNPFYGYDGHTQNFDAYCDNDNMVIIKSAGNEYSSRTITNPGTGKNVIAVGAIYYVTSGSEIIGQRAGYSSQGPTADDSRLKPDIVAPGGDDSWDEGVVSTSSDPWDAGSGYSGNINNNYQWPEWQSDDAYIRLSGTSMAAPHVTGVCAKIKQHDTPIVSEALKAILINNTIPLKANSTDALGGYANTQVGYGMANGFSVTNYYPGEYSQLLSQSAWLTEDDDPLYTDYSISVPSGSKQLIVTLAYNDQEGETSDSDALIDDMDLILISPGGTYYYAHDHKATGVTTESPLEKMVITNPATGTWTVRVRFTDSPGFGNIFIYAEQRYGVHAAVILKTPGLSLSVPQTTINVNPSQSFNVQPTVTNTGGYIAAGVTVKVEQQSGNGFGGDIDKSRFVGNLMYQNASISPQVNLTAPSTPGTYTLTVKVDGINREFSSGYPKTQQITVNVANPIYVLSNDTPVTFSDIPKNFSFTVNSSDWCGVAINPSSDHDIKADDNSDFSSPYASSTYGGTIRDFVVTNGHSWGSTTHYAQVYYGSASNYTIEAQWDIPDLSVGSGYSESMSSGEVIEMYEVPLTSGQTYQLNLDITSGSGDLAVFVFKPSRNSGSRDNVDWSMNNSGAGGDETLTFTADVTGDYGIAVINENASSANYTISVAVYVPPDTTPPEPNPMTWETEPYETSTSSISMTATLADDDSPPVYYEFDFVDSPTGGSGGDDRSWSTDRTYTDSGLGVNNQYGYRVRARDSATTPNIGNYSTPTSYDYTDIETPSGVEFGTITTTSIQARSSNTPSGLTRGSSGLIIFNVTSGTDSSWKQNNDYWNSGSLSVNTQYGFKARARNGDTDPTPDSPTAYKYTYANAPGVSSFSNVTENCIQANWTANGNPAGTQYLCENITRGTNSGWTSNIYWNECGLTCETQYCYQVRAKNGDGVETTPISLSCQNTLSCPAEINVKQGSTNIPDNTGSYDFGTVDVGQNEPVTFTIENLGSGNLDLTGSPKVEVSGPQAGDFVVTQQPSTPVGPSSSTAFEITFSPSSGGLRTATVYIANNDTDENPYNFAVTGTGNQLFTINASAGLNGTVEPNGVFDVNGGDELVFTATADGGFMVDQWRVDENLAQIGGSTYALSDIQSNHSVEVTFRAIVGILYVDANSPNDPGSGIPEDPFRNIQDGINAAIAGIEVHVAEGEYLEAITMKNGVNLYGGYDGSDWNAPRDPCTNLTIIDANGLNDSVIFVSDVNTVIEGFTITNGQAEAGGGVYSINSNILFTNCIISNNRTREGDNNIGSDGGCGGGVYCISSTVGLVGSDIRYNSTGSGGDNYGGWDDGGPGGCGGAGGGIYCDSTSNLSMLDCRFSGNTTGCGGGGGGCYYGDGGRGGNGAGIYCSSATIEDCTITNNTTGNGGSGGRGEGDGGDSGGDGGDGAGIYSEIPASLRIRNCTITGNATGHGGDVSWHSACGGYGGQGGCGGGIFCVLPSSIIEIQDCTVTENRTGRGGDGQGWSGGDGGNGGDGAGIFGSSIELVNCTIIRNSTGAGGFGGGNSPADGGNSGHGAGVYSSSSTITNCTVANNSTGDGGGGGWELGGNGGNGGSGGGIFGPNTSITNCTISMNTTGIGGLAEVYWDYEVDGSRGVGAGIYADSNTVIINTIIWDNAAEQIYGHNCSNVTYCDIGDGICSSGLGNISTDPCFADENYHLQCNSPCINSGDPNYEAEAGETDFEGNPRIIGGRIDMGADEYWDGKQSDFNGDGIVNFNDFAILSYYWIDALCIDPDWCEGCDYNQSGTVDIEDIKRFTEDWLWVEEEDINLVGYWKFDEGSGQFAEDSSGHLNGGTLKNGPVWGDGILCFDGNDDWVEVNDSNTLDITNQITLSAWVYFDNNPTKWTKVVIKPYQSYSDPWELYCIDFGHKSGSPAYNVPRFIITDGVPASDYGIAYDVNYTLPEGSWHQIVGTYDGSIAILYVNSQPVASSSATLQIGANDMPLSIGGRLGTNDSFNGCVDNVRIYNRALAQEEVATLYNEELSNHQP